MRRNCRHIRKIPDFIRSKLEALSDPKVVVMGTKRFNIDHLRKGELSHLDVTVSQEGEVACPSEPVIPDRKCGYVARHNQDGYEIIHRELPKEIFYQCITSPNFGDVTKGWHTSMIPRYRYPRTRIAEMMAAISVQLLGTDTNHSTATLFFRVECELDRTAIGFERDLFHCLNLLMECTGTMDIGPCSENGEGLIPTEEVSWEIFPPDGHDDYIKRFFGKRTPSPQETKTFRRTHEFLMKLHPIALIKGGFSKNMYFGAKIKDDLIVFDCPRIGNAIYILHKDWEFVSKHSRRELLSGKLGVDFERIRHSGNWEIAALTLINSLK